MQFVQKRSLTVTLHTQPTCLSITIHPSSLLYNMADEFYFIVTPNPVQYPNGLTVSVVHFCFLLHAVYDNTCLTLTGCRFVECSRAAELLHKVR